MPPAEHPMCLAGLLALSFELIACAPEPDEPDPFVPRYETDHLRVGTNFSEDLCRGHLEMWEDHIGILEQELGVSRDLAWLMVYGSYEDVDQVREDCDSEPNTLRGCWRDPVARALLDLVPHELVHAWAGASQPRPLRSLSEGLATRFSGLVPHADASSLEYDDLLLGSIPFEKYDELSHFIAWLMDTHGADATMALYARAEHGMSADAFDAAIQGTLGLSLAELLSSYRATAAAYYPAAGAAACGQGPVIPWKDGAAIWAADGSCIGGPFFGFERSTYWQRVTIDVDTPGTYELDPGGRPASLTRCLTDPVDALPELAPSMSGDWRHDNPGDDLLFAYGFGPDEDWTEIPLELDAGRHEVWVRRSQEAPSPPDARAMSLRRIDVATP